MSNHDRKGPPSLGEGAAADATQDSVQETALKRAWQQASNERPPPELDAAIIAAARKSVQDHRTTVDGIHASPKSRHRWMRWQSLAAAAGVAGLAFVLVQLMPGDRDAAPSIRMEGPGRGPATAEEKQSATAPAAAVPEEAATSGATTPADAAAQPMAEDEAGASSPMAPPPQAKAGAPAPAIASHGGTATNSMEVDQQGSLAPQMPTPAPPAAAAAAARERNPDNATPLRAEDWAARIAALYASGDVTGAADALRTFRAADPRADAYLPDSLRDWAGTVR